MSLRDAVQRLANSRTVPDYHWWNGEDFAKVAEEVLKDPENVKVLMFEGLTEDGTRDVWFKVVPTNTVLESVSQALDIDVQTFNISHPCPPLCD